MGKRLFRVVAVLIASSGFALVAPAIARADQSPGISNSQQSTTVVDSSDSTTSTTTTTTINQDGSSTNTTATAPTAEADSSGTSNTAGSSTPPTATEMAVTGQDQVPSVAAVISSDQIAAVPVGVSLHDKIAQAMAAVASNQAVEYYTQTSNPIAAALPVATSSNQPPTRQPLPAQGALGALNGMLASVVMPAAGKFTIFIPVSQVPLGSARMLLVVAILVEAITLSSLFVEYLRRSGFHAAARGDGAVANLIFATHEKWTLFGHLSSGRRPLFDGENKMRLAFVPAYVTNAI